MGRSQCGPRRIKEQTKIIDILSRKIWERKYVDLWTIIHLLTGMCFGFAIFFYGSPFVGSLIVFTFFATLWEVLEFVTRAKEPLSNQIIDILVGVLGFLATYTIVPIIAPSPVSELVTFTIIYLIVWTLAYFGFKSFALHSHRNVKQYSKSFSSALFLYIAILASIFFFR